MNRTARWTAMVLMAGLVLGAQAGWAAAEEQQGAAGGQQASPEEAQRAVQTVQEAMMPMMGQMMSVMLESMAQTLAKKDVAENLATFSRNYYQALIARGFSPEEALKIVTSTGIPTAGSKG